MAPIPPKKINLTNAVENVRAHILARPIRSISADLQAIPISSIKAALQARSFNNSMNQPGELEKLAEMPAQLRKLALYTEGFAFPEISCSGFIAQGGCNIVKNCAGYPELVLREQLPEYASIRDASILDTEIFTVAFLRDLAANPYLDLPIRVNVVSRQINSQTVRIIRSLNQKSTGDLYGKLMDHLPVDQIQHIFAQIILGLDALHRRGLAHRDLKPENILLSRVEKTKKGFLGLGSSTEISYAAKITDFDFIFAESTVGTECYASPSLLCEFYSGNTTQASSKHLADDVWALGLMLQQMLLMFPNKGLLMHANLKDFLKRRVTYQYSIPPTNMEQYSKEWQTVFENYWNLHIKNEYRNNNELKQLISCMLEFDETKRYTLEQVKNSAFFKNAIQKLDPVIPCEVNEDELPFWLLASKIRNIAKNINALGRGDIKVDRYVVFAFSHQVEEVLRLIGQIPHEYRLNSELKICLESLIYTLLSQPNLYLPELVDELNSTLIELNDDLTDDLTIESQAFLLLFNSIVADIKAASQDSSEQQNLGNTIRVLFLTLDNFMAMASRPTSSPVAFIEQVTRYEKEALAPNQNSFFSGQRLERLQQIELHWQFSCRIFKRSINNQKILDRIESSKTQLERLSLRSSS